MDCRHKIIHIEYLQVQMNDEFLAKYFFLFADFHRSILTEDSPMWTFDPNWVLKDYLRPDFQSEENNRIGL